MIAGSNTGRNAGEYVSIGVIPDTTATNDIVVAVWYDQTERVLKYAYNDSPLTNRNGQTSGAEWKGVKNVFSGDSENAGEYRPNEVNVRQSAKWGQIPQKTPSP